MDETKKYAFIKDAKQKKELVDLVNSKKLSWKADDYGLSNYERK